MNAVVFRWSSGYIHPAEDGSARSARVLLQAVGRTFPSFQIARELPGPGPILGEGLTGREGKQIPLHVLLVDVPLCPAFLAEARHFVAISLNAPTAVGYVHRSIPSASIAELVQSIAFFPKVLEAKTTIPSLACSLQNPR